jgi:hypothetical protein
MTDPYDPTFNHSIGSNGRDATSSLLDEDRLASMADEGGVSGALMEIDDNVERRRLIAKQRSAIGLSRWRTAAIAFALVGMAAIAWSWVKRTA